MSQKKSFFSKLSDLTHIHHRAAFSDVHKRTSLASEFLNLTKKRFSCRSFSGQPVSDRHIEAILEAGRLAPTAANRQPVHVWRVASPEGLSKLKEATRFTFDAPVVFVVGCRKEDAWVRGYDGHNEAEVDASIVCTHMMLEAADLGLGSTWVASFDPEVIKSLFPQTQGWQVVALLPVGHPSGEPSSRHSERKPIEEFSSVL